MSDDLLYRIVSIHDGQYRPGLARVHGHIEGDVYELRYLDGDQAVELSTASFTIANPADDSTRF